MDTIDKNDLIIANKKLECQIQQKEKRVMELYISNKELSFQNQENKKCHAELTIAHNDLITQNKENEKQSIVLLETNNILKKAQVSNEEYIEGLESILFMTSHRIRQPVTNILGLSNLLDESKNSNNELNIIIGFIKQSVLILDLYTQELTSYTYDLKQKVFQKKR